MHDQHAAFAKFRELTKVLANFPEAEQIRTLECELLQALYRTRNYEARNELLERRVEALKAERAERAREHQEYAARLSDELALAKRELLKTKSEFDGSLRELRGEVLAADVKCAELEELCRSLLLTIERAACCHAEASPTTLRAST